MFSFYLFSVSLLHLNIVSSTGIDREYGESLPNSCIGLDNGDYWLQLSTDDTSYNPVKLKCSNEYVILDVNKDNDLKDYFSSFEMWHYKLGGPANHDPVTWQEWFLPNNQKSEQLQSSYLISPDCNVCDHKNINEEQTYGTDTTYWMTGNLPKLHWAIIGFNECDMDYDTYQCYNCQSCMDIGGGCEPEAYSKDETDYSKSGICGVTIQKSNIHVTTQRAISQDYGVNYKPSIGTESEFCVCYKPDKKLKTKYEITDEQEKLIVTKENELLEKEKEQNVALSGMLSSSQSYKPRKNKKIPQKTGTIYAQTLANDAHETNDKEEIFYLSQGDFAEGTYNIRESGTYMITEDIIFDFNSNDDYWPRGDQIDKYPGADSYRDAYHLGFFAGITVECDDVIIDLNGHTLSMSYEFYYQQRWFAIIELGNQQFLPGQGPAFFGENAIIINNIEIKNGVLGLSSHFGIHGNFPTNIKIENIHVKDFVTHGIQLNGWENLIMNNIEVGPSSEIEYLRGDYGHARILAQRLDRIEDTLLGMEDDDEYDKSLGRSNGKISNKLHATLSENSLNDNLEQLEEIKEELSLQMQLAYNYAMNRINNKFVDTDYVDPDNLITEEDKERWMNAKQQFIHESGYPSSSSISGIFLNFEGASVFSYTMYTTHPSCNGTLTNIYIHDISHDMYESMRFSYKDESGQLYPTPWNSDIPAEHSLGGKDFLQTFYSDIIQPSKDSLKTDDEIISLLNDAESNKYRYKGTILTDVYFTMGLISDSWDELGFLHIYSYLGATYDIVNWVTNNEIDDNILNWRFGCNQDIMGHSGKGLLGLRIDGVDRLTLSNVKVENLNQYSQLGSDACGEYWRFTPDRAGGHFKQSSPMQYGFSGNDLQGISIIASSNVKFVDNTIVTNLYNDYSQSFGISMWTANNINFNSNSFIKINNILSGTDLLAHVENERGTKLTYESLPNRSPESCGVRMQDSGSALYYKSYINFDNNDNGYSNIITCNINGREKCLGEDNNDYTMYGSYHENSDVCDKLTNHQELQHYLGDQDRQLDKSMETAPQDQPPAQQQQQLQPSNIINEAVDRDYEMETYAHSVGGDAPVRNIENKVDLQLITLIVVITVAVALIGFVIYLIITKWWCKPSDSNINNNKHSVNVKYTLISHENNGNHYGSLNV